MAFPKFESRNNNELKSYLKKRHESMNVTQTKFGIPKDLISRATEEDKKSVRSRSIISSKVALKEDKPRHKTLKLIGGQTITLPARERFNEAVESAINEGLNNKNNGINSKNIANLSKDRLGALTCESSKSKLTPSRITGTSKKTKTAQEL